MSNTKKRFLVGQTIFTLVSGALVGLVIKYCFPEHYFIWYPVIPAFFYVFGWFYIFMFDECKKYSPNRMHMVYLSMKVAKMLISMFVLLVYIMSVKVHKEDFVLTFLLFYILSLIYENWFFYTFERNQKKEKENKNEKN